MFNLTNKWSDDKVLSFKSEFVILNSDENTLTFHLTTNAFDWKYLEELWVGEIGSTFNQKPDGNGLDTGKNWTTFKTTDW